MNDVLCTDHIKMATFLNQHIVRGMGAGIDVKIAEGIGTRHESVCTHTKNAPCLLIDVCRVCISSRGKNATGVKMRAKGRAIGTHLLRGALLHLRIVATTIGTHGLKRAGLDNAIVGHA
ncbi:hypothetical protein ACIQUS_26310 [Pseudomonas sp. NPDC090755]|uniref:hypothetical protein n=1 Tax=Pseudomonas sp. NPDC090755 TaxID=3364481 RepID=UPI00383BA13C